MRTLRVLIIGGGTAGYMAAAHLSKHFPDISLVHAFDPRFPSIGVGEGTTPEFPQWLAEVTGESFASLRESCNATLKRGIRFEGWGARSQDFTHEFIPDGRHAYHLAARYLPDVLGSASNARILYSGVRDIQATQLSGNSLVTFNDGSEDVFNLVVKAIGFPASLAGPEYVPFRWIPTNAALVGQSPSTASYQYTRSIARKHGWVFVIPLTSYTSYGYVYSQDAATPQEVEEDYINLLAHDDVVLPQELRVIRFPNFSRRRVFDGRVFHIGNCASFVEPLEAPAIGVIGAQLHLMSFWLLEMLEEQLSDRDASERVEAINATLFSHMLELSGFISWHYSEGANCGGYFWERARALASTFTTEMHSLVMPGISSWLDARISEAMSRSTLNRWSRRLEAQDALDDWRFGGFPLASFAQLAAGLGLSQLSEDNKEGSSW